MNQASNTRSTAPSANEGEPPQQGIALRDWLAGQALSGMIPAPSRPGVLTMDMDGMAKAAYAYADAMIAARNIRRT